MVQLKILISGAGVAGNALAFWLSKLGHDVTVVERFPGLRVNGLQIDLRGHGIEVMKRMGLERSFRSNAAPEEGMQLVDRLGKRWAYFPANKSGKGAQSITSEFEIMRGDLCRIMYDVAKDRVKYVFGTSIDGFEEKGGVVEVRFADGKTDRFDLLVGADGQGSRTRKMMLGYDTADGLQPLNECVAYFTIPRPIQDGEDYIGTGYIAPGGRIVLTRRHSPHKIQVYLMGKTITERLKSVQRGNVKEEKEAFAEIFRGAGWQTEAILEALKENDDFYCEHQGLVKLDCWSRGRVTLIGDAGYCSADTGMGTSCAMVGAYVLAGEIGKYCGRPSDPSDNTQNGLFTALKAYEDKFRPFIDTVQHGIGDPSFFDKIPWTPFTISIAYRAMWAVSLLRLDLVGNWFLNQNLDGWDLPEYEMLKD